MFAAEIIYLVSFSLKTAICRTLRTLFKYPKAVTPYAEKMTPLEDVIASVPP